VLGAILAAGSMGSSVRRKAVRAVEAAANQPGIIPEPFVVRRLLAGIPILRPPRFRSLVKMSESQIPAHLERWCAITN
jgi:hypothetical protein